MSNSESGQFRLVFAGELAEGQHAAVVKKRLAAALKLDASAADKLFAGEPVVVKKAASRDVAARLQRTFRDAGARLRVRPLQEEREQPASTEAAPAPGEPSTDSQLKVLPPQPLPAREQAPVAEVDTSHLSVSEPGVDLLDTSPLDEAAGHVAPDPDFELLPPGEGAMDQPAATPVVVDVDFDLAAVGETLVEPDTQPPPPAPDVSHLDLVGPDEEGSLRSG